jgi:hypothetical protein
VIQGDVKGKNFNLITQSPSLQFIYHSVDDLFDVIPEKWKEIDEDCIDDLGDQKR